MKTKLVRWEAEEKTGADSLPEVVSRAFRVYKKTCKDTPHMPPDDIGDKFDSCK